MSAERTSQPIAVPTVHPAGRRLFLVCGLAILIALGAGLLAEALTALIGLFTNLAF
jgi:hypothetical protein